MAVIQKPTNDKLIPGNRTEIDSMELPDFRFLLAQQDKTLKNVLIRSPYALGDCICSVPAVTYARKHFAGCEISIVTPFPEVFQHIPLKKVYKIGKDKPDWPKYFVLEAYHSADALQSSFVHNFNMAIDDYIAVSFFKGMIPTADRPIVLCPSEMEKKSIPPQEVVIHAGKHWMSKTFPKKWWDLVIHHLLAAGVKPALIGAKIDDGKRGYVEVDATHCLDLRDKLTIMQSVAVLQQAKVVLTNDSAPYHMAASGRAHIGVFSTVRHIDFIGHWRWNEYEGTTTPSKVEWNHKIENLAKGCMWQNSDVTPTRNGGKYDVIDYNTLMSWLPAPQEVCEWTLAKLREQQMMNLSVPKSQFDSSALNG